MAQSLNKVTLIGRLGRDPELRYTPTGKPVATASLAVDHEWKNSDGEKQKDTTWFNLEFWNSTAEYVNNYGGKGRLMYIEGRYVKDRYTDKETGETRYFDKVVCNQAMFLDTRKDAQADEAEEEEEQINFSIS